MPGQAIHGRLGDKPLVSKGYPLDGASESRDYLRIVALIGLKH
jgi:hypothetical protein